MMPILGLLGCTLAVAIGVPCMVLAAEIFVGLGDRVEDVPQAAVRTTIIIPAHNEGAGIGHTIRALIDTVPPTTAILVVADNCSDDTAQVARRCGAEVIERTDPVLRGKGYALAFARDWLAALDEARRPDVVLVLDADCRMAPGAAEKLAGACKASGRPAQARNLLDVPQGAGALVRISCFAFLVKNLLRARGLYRLSGAITLMGTGMAFPWPLFSGLPLATGHIAEDIALGVDLIREGRGAMLVTSAHITSPPAAQADTLDQRTRWEHGFLTVATTQALPLVGEGLRGGRKDLILLGLDLMVPPLAMLVGLAAGAAAVLLGLALLGGSAVPLIVLSIAIGAAAFAIMAGWSRFGRDVLPVAALLRVPLYVLWKLPVYLRFLTRRETRWIRTRRE